MKKILIAIKSTKIDVKVIEYALNLARKEGALIGIVEVTEYALGNIDAGVLPMEVEKNKRIQVKKELNELMGNYPNLIIKEFEPIGINYKEILNVVDTWKPDLLLIGHHLHNFFYKLFMPDVQTKLLDSIDIPVLIIPENK